MHLLDVIADHYGLTKTAAVEMMIREKAREVGFAPSAEETLKRRQKKKGETNLD